MVVDRMETHFISGRNHAVIITNKILLSRKIRNLWKDFSSGGYKPVVVIVVT